MAFRYITGEYVQVLALQRELFEGATWDVLFNPRAFNDFPETTLMGISEWEIKEAFSTFIVSRVF